MFQGSLSRHERLSNVFIYQVPRVIATDQTVFTSLVDYEVLEAPERFRAAFTLECLSDCMYPLVAVSVPGLGEPFRTDSTFVGLHASVNSLVLFTVAVRFE